MWMKRKQTKKKHFCFIDAVHFFFNKGVFILTKIKSNSVQTSCDVTRLHWQATVHTERKRYHSQSNDTWCSVRVGRTIQHYITGIKHGKDSLYCLLIRCVSLVRTQTHSTLVKNIECGQIAGFLRNITLRCMVRVKSLIGGIFQEQSLPSRCWNSGFRERFLAYWHCT